MRASKTVVPLAPLVALVAASSITFASIRVADACGCTSPPLPPPEKVGDYAVNQQSEQIIFEVEQNWVTAHVLIKYTGDPASFAWIVPVPEAPELSLSPASAFGLIDTLTAPTVDVSFDNECPVSEWQCRFHDPPSCGSGGAGCGGMQSAAGDDDDTAAVSDAAAGAGDAGGGQPPVEVIDEQVVGDYQTVTFRASEAAAAAQWLRDNGFIVNSTTTLYMESYVEANMVFVAAKLVPGAGVSSIKPLRMRYRAPFPMIPLVLTAVAAEPHLTVTAYVYGQTPFRPMSHPVVTIAPERIAQNRAGRLNYPMVLARTIDEAGGDAFAIEYQGGSRRPVFGDGSGCCGAGFDVCSLGGNTRCECPRDDFETADCADRTDLLEAIALVDDLTLRHPFLTRITTRISPEEMRFDPTFEPGAAGTVSSDGRMEVHGEQATLQGCVNRVMDTDDFTEADLAQECASVYCGAGQCAITVDGVAGCACDAGFVATQFTDLDGLKSVTCVPAVPTVDLGAGGEDLPDACANTSCNLGECHDRNGVAVCVCDGGAAAVADSSVRNPLCAPIRDFSGTPGGQDFSDALRTLAVCAPPAPMCAGGWAARVPSSKIGVDCGDATPPPEALIVPPAPTCDDDGIYGCGCSGGHPVSALALLWITGFLLMRKRRRPVA